MNMQRYFNKWKFVLIILLFNGCTQTFSMDYSEKETQDILLKGTETTVVDVRQEESECLTSTDWFVYGRELYVKTGENIYEKRDVPRVVQNVLQERKITYFFLKKEENKLVIESETGFFIYDFNTNRVEEYNTEYGHLDWQIFQNKIYCIVNTNNTQTRLMVYDMVRGDVNEIDTDEYRPVQFHVRRDGAIGMWGENAKGDKEYCFLEGMAPIYVPDRDEYFGWTYLCGFTERGIILEREYPTSSLQGTKIYGIMEDGEISILAGLSDWDNLKAIPEGSRIFTENEIISINLSNSLVKAYDYEFSCTRELHWDIEANEDMVLVGYYVHEDDIWGIWQLGSENIFKLGLLIQSDFLLER
ncbi:MAG: hypothetical protein K2L07_07140 [Lachnospiraceae bacterium]|nr:hypothetical protein [Lachnospiraceae bacterium]